MNATFDKYAFNEIIYDLPFTKKEQEVVKELLEADGKPVPREQLCKVVFNKSDTNSAKSQLSSMVKKIKIKLSEEKMDYVCLKTVWGSGYQLIFRK
ncbi:helix-turn-helix domain-containing protein [Enterococcus sp. 3H8_DIV0648]|uniref:helix-turn-helix domain-containing protein n=1 Tax=Enterococcus sp. 3H8_DIV0648 TaxID=1834178 RepID=UPI000B6EB577|nr:helix-turn-helix domain-containing protein [Enterococcus sp. 3H8_DIV0648]OTO10679.1 hypothetical protein A5875_004651 [Enterococcus sp. 3H8_DIV0648]